MRTPHVDDRVRLLGSVPNTALCRGQVGVVCSEWAGTIGSDKLFEVEFKSPIGNDQIDVLRRLVPACQMELAEEDDKAVMTA